MYEMKGNEELDPGKAAKILEKSGWTKEDYKLGTIDNYNEFYYFHPNVKEAIFNKRRNEGMEFLKRTDFNKLKVEYYDKDNIIKIKTIETQVNEIDIHLFDNQIGLLAITTEKQEGDEKTDFQALLKYNDIARRVYPPHLGNINACGFKEDAEKKGEIKIGNLSIPLRCETTCKPKYETGLLPLRISLCKDRCEPISEPFKSIDLEANKEKDIVSLSNIITELLLPFELKDQHDKKMDKGKIYYTPFIDDRMFIVSYYADKGLSDKLIQRCCNGYEYETSDDWYRYIFVDGGGDGIANNAMKKSSLQNIPIYDGQTVEVFLE